VVSPSPSPFPLGRFSNECLATKRQAVCAERKVAGHPLVDRDFVAGATSGLILMLDGLSCTTETGTYHPITARPRARKRHLIAAYVTCGNQDVNRDTRREMDACRDKQNEYARVSPHHPASRITIRDSFFYRKRLFLTTDPHRRSGFAPNGARLESTRFGICRCCFARPTGGMK